MFNLSKISFEFAPFEQYAFSIFALMDLPKRRGLETQIKPLSANNLELKKDNDADLSTQPSLKILQNAQTILYGFDFAMLKEFLNEKGAA